MTQSPHHHVCITVAQQRRQKVRRTKPRPISDWVHVCVSMYVHAILTHEEPSCLSGRQTRGQDETRKSKKLVFSSLSEPRYAGSDSPSPLRLSIPPCHRARAAAAAAMLGRVPCAPSSRHGGPLAAFSPFKAGQWLWCVSRRIEWKCHIKTRWRLFYCRRAVPTERSDTGGTREKELWIHIEYQFLPSADTPAPPNSHSPSSVSLSISHFVLASLTALPQSHSFSSFFIHLCILLFFPPSLLSPSAQCNYSNGFFPLGWWLPTSCLEMRLIMLLRVMFS